MDATLLCSGCEARHATGAAQIWSSIPGDRGTCSSTAVLQVQYRVLTGKLLHPRASSHKDIPRLLLANSGHVVKDEAKLPGHR